MCLAKKCCFFIKLDTGCVFIGVMSFMLSTAMIITSIVYLTSCFEEPQLQYMSSSAHEAKGPHKQHPQLKFMAIEFTVQSLKIILFSTLAMEIFLNIASILLLIGLWKKKPGFVLFYFGFGIFFVIFSQLVALLLLLQNHWMPSIVFFAACPIFIHFLVVVYTVYEDMQRKISHHISQERLIPNHAINSITEPLSLNFENEGLE